MNYSVAQANIGMLLVRMLGNHNRDCVWAFYVALVLFSPYGERFSLADVNRAGIGTRDVIDNAGNTMAGHRVLDFYYLT